MRWIKTSSLNTYFTRVSISVPDKNNQSESHNSSADWVQNSRPSSPYQPIPISSFYFYFVCYTYKLAVIYTINLTWLDLKHFPSVSCFLTLQTGTQHCPEWSRAVSVIVALWLTFQWEPTRCIEPFFFHFRFHPLFWKRRMSATAQLTLSQNRSRWAPDSLFF